MSFAYYCCIQANPTLESVFFKATKPKRENSLASGLSRTVFATILILSFLFFALFPVYPSIHACHSLGWSFLFWFLSG